jgi:hypothetical protein
MRHRSDCDDTCNGDWCLCSCHQVDALELGEFDDGSRPDLTRWSR